MRRARLALGTLLALVAAVALGVALAGSGSVHDALYARVWLPAAGLSWLAFWTAGPVAGRRA